MVENAAEHRTRSRTLLWTAGLGAVTVVVLVVVAVVNDLRWSVPAVVVVLAAGVLPTARAYGASRARAAGQEARARREAGG